MQTEAATTSPLNATFDSKTNYKTMSLSLSNYSKRHWNYSNLGCRDRRNWNSSRV